LENPLKRVGGILDKIELEDEIIVENIQKGILSLFYKAMHFSPTKEQGLHHFYRLLANFLNG